MGDCKTLTALIAASSLAVGTAIAAQDKSQPNPYQKHDESWIGISGTVTSAKPDSFMLDYGDGEVIVEMDDWDWYREGYKILKGDEVTVYGEIDDDIFETTSIEANSVYVKGLNSFFFASSDDEETYWRTVTYIPAAQTHIQGTVKEVNDREITLDTGNGTLTVNTLTMSYNPLDKEGYQQIGVGDKVRITGQMDEAFFGDREFNAKTITSISSDKGAGAS